MRLHTEADYRKALDDLHRLTAGRDEARRRELEAAIESYAQEHNNSKVRPGRPSGREAPGSKNFREDR
jgi:hypothetical protein